MNLLPMTYHILKSILRWDGKPDNVLYSRNLSGILYGIEYHLSLIHI